MKIYVSIILGLFLVLETFAVDLLVENAEWYVDVQIPSFGGEVHGYIRFAEAGDSLFHGVQATMLSKESITSSRGVYKSSPYFVYEDSSRMYYWNGKKYQVYLDFNLAVGDTLDWTLTSMDSITDFIVTGYDTLEIDGEKLVSQSMVYSVFHGKSPSNYHTNTVTHTERLSAIGFYTISEILVDGPFPNNKIRCYSDSEISYTFSWFEKEMDIPCDGLINIVSSEEVERNFRAFVSENSLWIEGDVQNSTVDVYTIAGSLITTTYVTKSGRVCELPQKGLDTFVVKVVNSKGKENTFVLHNE